MVRYAVAGCRVPKIRASKGVGRYADDIRLANLAHGYTSHPYVLCQKHCVSSAKAVPGVLAILTGADFEAAGLNGIVTDVANAKRPDGTPIFRPPRPALVTNKVRVVGDHVAFVVAETLDQAKDAAELIEVDYEPLPAMVGTAAAAEPDAVPVWDECPDNISFEHNVGDAVATEAAFAKADVVVKQQFVINRVSTNSMENRLYR